MAPESHSFTPGESVRIHVKGRRRTIVKRGHVRAFDDRVVVIARGDGAWEAVRLADIREVERVDA